MQYYECLFQMFSFNFEVPRDEEDANDDVTEVPGKARSPESVPPRPRDDVHIPCVEVVPPAIPGGDPDDAAIQQSFVHGPVVGAVRLRYLSQDGLKASSREFLELDSSEASDLVPGTYEGGFKVSE